MSRSPLAKTVMLSNNYNKMLNKVNRKITIHHMAGNLTFNQLSNTFANRKCSSNYAIDSNGKVGLFVEEEKRSWASASYANDSQAVTIEVANNSGAPNWTISDKAMKTLIDLCVDICQRNNIKELIFTGDKNGTLTYHYMFCATACPGPYIKSKTSYICDEVNKRLKGVEPDPEQPAPSKVKKTNEELAKECIQGKWGNYPERKKLLEDAGYCYRDVQTIVNDIVYRNRKV